MHLLTYPSEGEGTKILFMIGMVNILLETLYH